MEQTNAELGEGKLFKLMIKFSVPCVLSLLVSALYNIVDQIFIGHSAAGDLGDGRGFSRIYNRAGVCVVDGRRVRRVP